MRIREVFSSDDTSRAPVVQQRSLIYGKKLGNRIKIASAPNASLGQVQTGTNQRLIHIQGDDNLAVPLTVFFDVTDIVSSGAGLAYLVSSAYLEVSWGAGGYNTRAEVDLGWGGCFTVFASSLTVDLITPSQFNSVNYSMEVGAYVVPGVRPASSLPPTRTHRLVNASGGAQALAIGASTTLLSIPPYSKSVTLIANPTSFDTVPELRFVLANSAGTEVMSFRYGEIMHSSQHHTTAPSPLPGGLWESRRYKVVNTLTDSVALDRVIAVFALAL